ncbi:17176_t:CDS:1, partial [Funneliformis caledonium]
TNKASIHHSEYSTTTSIQNENIKVWNVYGPSFVNCFVIGSITYIGLHVLWYKLAFIELQQEMENKMNELENKIKCLKKNKKLEN